jgi:hypothetical protein
VTLLVGDPSISQGIQWQLGVVELVLPEADGKPLVRTVKTQPSSNQKPIINHIFVSQQGRMVCAQRARGPDVATVVLQLSGN